MYRPVHSSYVYHWRAKKPFLTGVDDCGIEAAGLGTYAIAPLLVTALVASAIGERFSQWRGPFLVGRMYMRMFICK